jgi:hypothetical protein
MSTSTSSQISSVTQQSSHSSDSIHKSSGNGGYNNIKTPLMLFQPFNIVVFLSFYSPVLLALSVTSMSLLFQNFKGFIYLGYLMAVCLVRNYAYKMGGAKPSLNDGTICTSVQYSKYGNPTFSAFVFAFTLMYLLYPMFSNGSINFWLVGGMLAYFFIDIFIKTYKKCKIEFGDMFLNILLGMFSAVLIIVLMYAGGSSQYLFFNETQNNKEVCSMPSEQTFKCNVYKNGELIGAI